MYKMALTAFYEAIIPIGRSLYLENSLNTYFQHVLKIGIFNEKLLKKYYFHTI